MTASTGVTGAGVAFKVGDGGGTEVFTTVANVKDVKINGRSVEEVDFTHLGSTGGYKEFRPGFKDPGNIQFTMHFDPTHLTHGSGARGIEGMLNSGLVFNFEIDYSATGKAKKFTGKGFVKSDDISVTVADPLSADVTIRVTGPLSLVDA